MTPKKGLLERLDEGVVIGDGGFVWQLEKRGYVKAGAHTPECVIERPEAVLSLHREFLDAGSDIMQAYTFYASDDRLSYRGNTAKELYTSKAINEAACALAHKAASYGDCLVSASISQIPMYQTGVGKEKVQAEFKKQVDVYVDCKVDLIICEFFKYIEEMEWAIEVCKASGLPVVATMCIAAQGDYSGVSIQECAVRMAKAGADVVGVNCLFDPITTVKSIKLMKEALDAAGIKKPLAAQPLAFHVPEEPKTGYWGLPDYPFTMEPRQCTRFDFSKYAREAYEAGARLIGGCCGSEAYHIRAITEELLVERGDKPLPHSLTKHEPWGGALSMSNTKYVNDKANREFWEKIEPTTGRPRSAAMCCPYLGD